MGLLQVHSDGVKLEEGESEFLSPIYAEEIHSREVRSSPTHTLSWCSFPHPSSLHPSHPPSSVFFILKLLSSVQKLSDCLPNTAVGWKFSPHAVIVRLLLSASFIFLDIFWKTCQSKVELAVTRSARGGAAAALSLPINLQDVCGRR